MTPEEGTREIHDLIGLIREVKYNAPNPVQDMPNILPVIQQCVDDATAELQAVVDKLPKYADTGKPIVPGKDDVWLTGSHWMSPDMFTLETPLFARLIAAYDDHVVVGFDDGEPEYWDGPMYSTCEAAEAAKEKDGG